MPYGIVTALAELRGLPNEELCMVAAMRGVTGPAVFLHGGMFPKVGAALVSMAGVAQLVDRIGLDHLRAEPAMLVVAIVAGDAPLFHRVVGLFIPFGPYDPMAAPA
jgi:hypothetical protein